MCDDEFNHEKYTYTKLENLSEEDLKELGITPEEYSDMGEEMQYFNNDILKVGDHYYIEDER